MQLPSPKHRASLEQQRSKVGFPIRKFPDQSLFAAPRNLSQRTTSFIASQRQGIHQIPLRHLIALIAKARSFPRASPASFRPRVSSKKPPIGKSAANSRFGAKRPVLLQTHPGTLAVSQRIHDWLLEGSGDREGASSTKNSPEFLSRTPSRLRSSTECASSSQCQISQKDQTTHDRRLFVFIGRPFRPFPLEARPWRSQAKLINRIGSFFRHRLALSPPPARSRAKLVEPDGIEPTTSCLQSTRSPN